MSRECVHVDDTTSYRYYNLWYDSKEDAAITARRINTGIDFRANTTARQQMSANTYLLYMSLITLPLKKQWILSELHLDTNTSLSEDDIVHGLQELSDLGYLALTNKRKSAITIFESPHLKSKS